MILRVDLDTHHSVHRHLRCGLLGGQVQTERGEAYIHIVCTHIVHIVSQALCKTYQK